MNNYLGRFLHYLLWPMRFLSLHGSHRARVLVMHGDNVLLIQGRITDGLWDLPGGGIGKDETSAQAAQREVEEELSLAFSEDELHELLESTVIRGGIRVHYTCFLAQVQSDEFKANKLEIAKAKWFGPDELPENSSPVVRQALKAVEK